MNGRFIFARIPPALILLAFALLLSSCPRRGPVELKYDDGISDGQLSVAGGGHATKFTCPRGKNQLKEIKLYSSRYGRGAPDNNRPYWIYVLDGNFGMLQKIEGKYQEFSYASQGWWIKELSPTVSVTRDFWICFEFKPAQYYGVYVYYDRSSMGHSRSGTPGTSLNTDPGYEWMIRAVVD